MMRTVSLRLQSGTQVQSEDVAAKPADVLMSCYFTDLYRQIPENVVYGCLTTVTNLDLYEHCNF